MIKACLFDLDGVICDTAKYHFIAWQKVAHKYGVTFTEKENEALKGVSRVDSLKHILALGNVIISDEEFEQTLIDKNTHYLELISEMTTDEILDGVVDFLNDLQANNIAIGLGSASKNAPLILDKLGLTKYFKTIVHGGMVTHGKPHPEVFLTGAKNLNIAPENTVVFEDALAGIEAALAGNFYAIGVGSPQDLPNAPIHISTFANLTWQQLNKKLAQ